MSVTYIDEKHIIAKRQTRAPLNRSRTGYGSKLPTSWMLQLQDKRWRRVYVICYSNSGSSYILVKPPTGGKCEMQFLGSYDPSYNPSK